MAKRRLYKPERAPARKRGVMLYSDAPLGCPDALPGEVTKALYALALDAGFTIGRGTGYEPLRDEYHLIGKSKATGKAQDVTIAGEVVAELIRFARFLAGGVRVGRAMQLRQPV